ncbi:unnamed protein product [Didymodactylos carnosus]|uniref:Calpain catalytic domain-containing protein n=1 Tax=Didymodactylos carnosus TaxID=1234261 RepID=A0A814CH14_9BILA|nr:unnamed protein product [Didymodactylos carnosus]CAF3717789.1 unnamed protein product [Didymodactylos carnosus]
MLRVRVEYEYRAFEYETSTSTSTNFLNTDTIEPLRHSKCGHGETWRGSAGKSTRRTNMCWRERAIVFFIAAVQAIVSSQPNVLKSIVISELNDNQYRCIFYRQGEQIEIDVDLTNVPVDTNSNIPLYCRSTSENIVWPYVFEKAYSQFYGSYDNLIGEGFVTCGAIDNTIQVPTIRNGFRINHAYVILTTYIFQTQRYLLIHNPQGINDIQQENRLVRKAFFTSSSSYLLWENQQGTQFLAWKDLSKIYNRIQICYCTAKSIYNKPLFAQWTQSSSGGCSNLYSFYLNPFILIPHELKGKMLTILIGQNDQRCERTNPLQKLNYPQLGITVVKFQKQEHPEDERTFILRKIDMD